MNDGIEDLLEEILVDASGEDEQLGSFAQAFETSVRFPFPARVVGVAVQVTGVVYEGHERRGLVALCRREAEEHSVSVLDVLPGPVAVQTSMLVEAYRRGADWPSTSSPLGQRRPFGPTEPWRPRRSSSPGRSDCGPWASG